MSKYIPIIKHTIAFLVILFAVFISPQLLASGLLTSKQSDHLPLTIKQHHVDVVIENSFATTIVEQEFYNPNQVALEALYSFPIPDKAVVGEFSYWINGKQIIAEAVEKKTARQIYQEQKAQGQNTALAEKNDHFDFRIRVFPVPPQDTVKIRLVYLQNQRLDHGVGHYVYPLEEGGVDEQAKQFWNREEAVREHFSFNVTVKSAYPIDAMHLPSHPQAHIKAPDNKDSNNWSASITTEAKLETSAPNGSAMTLNKDISVYWRLAEGLPARIDMVAYRDPKHSPKGTVKLTFTPGEELAPITQGRDWVLILDKSGSMEGKYTRLIDGVKRGLSRLPASDRFKVILFDNQAFAIKRSFTEVSRHSVNQTLEIINQHQPGGGTNLYAALEEGLKNLDADRPTGIILLTDGEANVGVTERADFLDLVRSQDVRLFTFIMGNSANKPLLLPMTEISNGFAVNISNSDDMYGHIANVSSKLSYQSMQNIQLEVNGVPIKDPVITTSDSLYRGEQLTLLGHYFSAGKSDITLTATVNGIKRSFHSQITLPDSQLTHPELERLWAFASIEKMQNTARYLGDRQQESQQAITDIAMEYGLLTDYTSLLVVEEAVFEQLGIERKNLIRVSNENQKRDERRHSQPEQTRADNSAPMFSSPAPTHSSGGGALNLWLLLALLSMLLWRIRQSRR